MAALSKKEVSHSGVLFTLEASPAGDGRWNADAFVDGRSMGWHVTGHNPLEALTLLELAIKSGRYDVAIRRCQGPEKKRR
jgi:hypothetical protein